MLTVVSMDWSRVKVVTGKLSTLGISGLSALLWLRYYTFSLAFWSVKRLYRLVTVVTAFFMSTETHAKRLLTVWKRSVCTTLKRSFTVLANQINVSETFQAFQILTNHISVRKTLSWKPCLVSNVLAFAELANQNPADSIYFYIFFFFFFFSNFT